MKLQPTFHSWTWLQKLQFALRSHSYWHSAASPAANPPPPSESPRSPPTSATPRIEHGSVRANGNCDLADENIPTKITPNTSFILPLLHSTDFTTDRTTRDHNTNWFWTTEEIQDLFSFRSHGRSGRSASTFPLLFSVVLSCASDKPRQGV